MTGDIRLPAIILMPNGGNDVPIVVMVHGSGALDRDERDLETVVREQFDYLLPSGASPAYKEQQIETHRICRMEGDESDEQD